jgi:hypothetical protein
MTAEYQTNEKLMNQIIFKKPRSGKISLCLGVSELNRVKLKMAGNRIVNSFEFLPNSVIVEGKMMPYELEAINKYREVKEDVVVEFVEDLIASDVI